MGPTRNPPPSRDMGIETDEIEGKLKMERKQRFKMKKLAETCVDEIPCSSCSLRTVLVPYHVLRTFLSGNTDGKVSLNNMMNNLFRDHNLNKPVYHDLVKYKDKWFSIDQYGRGVMVDSSSKVSLVTNALFHLMWNGYYRNHKSYLVKSSGDADLYLVDRYMVKSSERTNYAAQHAATSGDDTKGPVYDMAVKFKVYKLEEEEQCWKEATSLNDLVIFVGEDASFWFYCVSAKDFPRCRGNMIYFTDKFRRFMGCVIT
ncbi:putative GDSL esterase/lipase-like [Capsicum annuum]|nr:putative GDSL esterase/lipase-like [Capsicum annuum]